MPPLGLTGLFDWLLPRQCGGCRTLGDWLCPACSSRVRALAEPLCPRCGRELEHARSGCGCRTRLRALKRARSAAVYEGPLEKAIHRFKYEGWKALAPTLAALVAEHLPGECPLGSSLVAVPLHPRRLRERGYNQSELLARELRRHWGIKAPMGSLVRMRDTPPQVGLDRLRRRQNVDSAFGWNGVALAGARIVLVDDVATTGATLEACAEALRGAGAGRVSAVTVARVSA